jgi:hypothetical protein
VPANHREGTHRVVADDFIGDHGRVRRSLETEPLDVVAVYEMRVKSWSSTWFADNCLRSSRYQQNAPVDESSISVNKRAMLG